jgi:hypothetical protein
MHSKSQPWMEVTHEHETGEPVTAHPPPIQITRIITMFLDGTHAVPLLHQLNNTISFISKNMYIQHHS